MMATQGICIKDYMSAPKPLERMTGESRTLNTMGGNSRLETFRNRLTLLHEINPNITVGLAITFLTVALNEGRSAREYAQLLDLPTSTMSRHLLDLGDINRKREPGLMLVEQKPNIMDRRSNIYTLTRKGTRLIAALIKTDGVIQEPRGGVS